MTGYIETLYLVFEVRCSHLVSFAPSFKKRTKIVVVG